MNRKLLQIRFEPFTNPVKSTQGKTFSCWYPVVALYLSQSDWPNCEIISSFFLTWFFNSSTSNNNSSFLRGDFRIFKLKSKLLKIMLGAQRITTNCNWARNPSDRIYFINCLRYPNTLKCFQVQNWSSQYDYKHWTRLCCCWPKVKNIPCQTCSKVQPKQIC